ncbi:MAG: GNAT family N-acetyltransferase [Spirochaetaceae bacterium]|nr:MAG: GNAT family N-acetyltransferase [Spirochaetaceae bacterium]
MIPLNPPAASTAYTIHPVSPADRTAIREFCAVSKRIYAGSQHWVPWFDRGLKKVIARRHSFFTHSDGDCFLIRRGAETVGRFALLEPKRFNEYRGTRDARFYFFDVEDDAAAVSAFIAHARSWAANRGLTRLIGPQGFSGFTGAGILIDGYDRSAAMTMMNYHHPYYRSLIESVGFTKYKDFVSAELVAAAFTPSEKQQRVMDLVRRRNRFTVPDLTSKQQLREVAREVGRIYNESWEDHEEFVPMTETELSELVEDLMLVSDPGLVKVIRRDDALVGFILAFPDLTRALQRAGGRLGPLQLLDILREKRRTRTFIINGVGILPEYRNQGGTALLFSTIETALRDRGVITAEMTQIAETTELMLAAMHDLGGRVYKTHRIYQMPV